MADLRLDGHAQLFGEFPGARTIGEAEQRSVGRVLSSRSLYRFYGLRLLKQVDALEAACRRSFGRRYALAVSSGTAALHTALVALGVSRGDEVILPAYAWSADMMAAVALGAVPVIAPIDRTLGLDPAGLAHAITRRTKAIITVHMRGQPCDVKAIAAIGKSRGIRVIEDAAQCLGGRMGGRPVGSWGDVSVLSFQYQKLLTAGEGGAVLMDHRSLHERAARFHDLGMLRRAGQPDPHGEGCIGSFGLNYRMNELQAAVLLAQMGKIATLLRQLRQAYQRALEVLAPACRRFGLIERPLVPGTQRNYTTIGFCAVTPRQADAAFKVLLRQGLPVQRCGQLDGHHFEPWGRFLSRAGYRYRLVEPGQSRAWLSRSLYLPLRPAG